MAISKGNTGIGKAYVGPKEVEKAFVGDRLVYQSAMPYDQVFGNNDWATIRKAVRSGNIPATWVVGDTKDITLSNNQTITYRICDQQAGRYALADGSGSSNMVLEPIDLISNLAQMNPINTNVGGFAESSMRTVTLANIYDLFPQDVKDAMSEVLVLSSTGGGSTSGTSSSANKLFLPAETEMFASKSYSIGNDECPLGQFDYYKTHNNNSDRIKKLDGSASPYWLRSPSYYGNSTNFCCVNSPGVAGLNGASGASGVAPFFAI